MKIYKTVIVKILIIRFLYFSKKLNKLINTLPNFYVHNNVFAIFLKKTQFGLYKISIKIQLIHKILNYQ